MVSATAQAALAKAAKRAARIAIYMPIKQFQNQFHIPNFPQNCWSSICLPLLCQRTRNSMAKWFWVCENNPRELILDFVSYIFPSLTKTSLKKVCIGKAISP
jgi:hypothetical protein